MSIEGVFITELEPRSATGRRWRSRTSSTPRACAPPTARRSSASTCRSSRRRRSTLLEAAGYAMVGKANLHEFAWGITSENDHYGWVPNPAAPGRVAGGSSGGCGAALAAGLADAALGQRLRRLDPDPGGVLRRRRHEGELRRRADRRLLAARADLRHRRADGPRRRRLRADDGGDGAGLRARRPGLARRPARRRRVDRPRRSARARAGRGGRRAVPAPARGRPPAAGRRLHRVRARGRRGPRRPVPRPQRRSTARRSRSRWSARCAITDAEADGGGPPARALHASASPS